MLCVVVHVGCERQSEVVDKCVHIFPDIMVGQRCVATKIHEKKSVCAHLCLHVCPESEGWQRKQERQQQKTKV